MSGDVRFEPGRTVPDEGLAGGDGFAAVGGEAIESDFAVVEALLPFVRGGVGVEGGEVGKEVPPVVLWADGGSVGIAPIEHLALSVRESGGYNLGFHDRHDSIDGAAAGRAGGVAARI